MKKLTEWEKEPDVATLKQDLEGAQQSHDLIVQKINHWNDLRNIEGSAKPAKVKGRSAIQPKLIRRQQEWRYSALAEPFLSSEKLFDVKPVTFEDQQSAIQNELLINWQFRTKINRVKLIDDYVRTTVDEGTCVLRVGWERRTEMVEVEVPNYTHLAVNSMEAVQRLDQAMAYKMSNPRGYDEQADDALKAAVDFLEETGEYTVAVQDGTVMVNEERIVENKPTVTILDWNNLFIDPSCGGDVDKANFGVISFETSKAELLKDGRYKNLDKVNWGGNTVLSQPDHATETPDSFNFNDELRKKVVAYEYWGFYDIHGNDTLVPIVATWVGDVMIRMEENPFPDQKLPFVLVPYLPIKRSLTGEPDAELLEDNQAVLGALTRGVVDLMGRSANSQQGFAKGFLDVTNRRRYENGLDYEFNPGAGDPRMSVHQHTYPELPQSALTVMQLQNSEAESLSGVKAFSGGLSGEAYGDVAAGIKGMLDASAKREMNILRRLSKGLQDVATKIMAMNAAFLADEEIIRVTNDNFVAIRRDELDGNCDLTCDISTPEIDQARAQDLGFMLQTMGPDMDPAMSRMILAEIARLKRMPWLAKQIEEYQPQPDPFEEQMKQLELQKLQKEIEKLDSEIQENYAQAGKLQSEKDQKDLDFVEQESGTKHARDIQKIGEQAKSQTDLAITKAIATPQKEGEQAPNIAAAMGYKALAENGAL